MSAKPKTLKKSENALMFGMIAPSFLFVIIMSVVPLCYTFILSFQEYNLLKPHQAHFNGIENYLAIFSDAAMRNSIWVTLKYTILSVLLSTLIGIGLAIVVNQLTAGKDFFRIIFFIPMMLSGVVVGVLWRFLFNSDLGVINYLLQLLHFDRISWTGSVTAAMASILIADAWQWSSYTFINVLAALDALNPEPLDAASVDGANALQLFFYIKLPSIMPVISISVVFRTIWAFRNFDLIYSLTSGGPGTSTTTMAVEIYRLAFNQYSIGSASALSVVMFLILMGVSIIILRRTIKGGN